MDNHIFDVGVIHVGPAGTLPGGQRLHIGREDADDIEFIGVHEIIARWIGDFAAKYQMQKGKCHGRFQSWLPFAAIRFCDAND